MPRPSAKVLCGNFELRVARGNLYWGAVSACSSCLLLATLRQELLPTYPHTKPRVMEVNSITSLPPELALHSQRHRHQKNANQSQSVPCMSPPCIWRVYGVCVACMWRVYGVYMACIWRVSGVYQACIWRVSGLLADTGIHPLQVTRYVHLAQLHFRLTIPSPDTLPEEKGFSSTH